MSFQLNRGLFQLDFTDHHAILGVPVTAEPSEIRKRYLKIARNLHPDTCKASSEEEKELAKQLLAKLVSPAYDKLQNEGERTEHSILLGQMAKRCVQDLSKAQIQSETAKQLLQAHDYENFYKTALTKLAENQYQNLSQTLDIITQISELNLVYLMRKEGKGAVVGAQAAAPKPPTPGAAPAAQKAAPPPPPPPPVKSASQVEQYYQRAEQWMGNNDFDKAILELKDALKIEPKNSHCHALLGMVYLKKKQQAMAKVHINKALELNPQEKVALDAKKIIEKPAQKAGAAGKKAAGKSPSLSEQAGDLFGGLFGGGSQPAQKGGQSSQKKTPPKPGNKPENPGGGIFGGLFGGGGKKK
ncbi:DnaJ domain-containing protein [Ancylothrix sp. C2]|uniref:J domain-containing protein n=1 Tax=Ancylothrix sp. D3o TaxID=2953691 RepID=UPI0021BBAB3B|nr:J domain-containing protein [Ancylothrix sp. D3o]MCT7951632.1 DnaJ domain-containing protein [Ancylothrix sp. D3o]